MAVHESIIGSVFLSLREALIIKVVESVNAR